MVVDRPHGLTELLEQVDCMQLMLTHMLRSELLDTNMVPSYSKATVLRSCA
jgi:hypothetical protein